MNSFGDRLKYLRAGSSQAELAEKLGIKQTTLSNYERCRNEPTYETLKNICSHFGVNTEWFMYGTGPMYPGEGVAGALATSDPMNAAANARCPRCAWLEAKVDKVEQQRDELFVEIRQLWKEQGDLIKKIGELERESEVLRERLKAVSGRGVAVETA